MGRPEPLPRYQLYMGGGWVEPAARTYFPSYNPYSQEPWAEISRGGLTDVKAAAMCRSRADSI